MKKNFTIQFLTGSAPNVMKTPVPRERIAYLLRAGRSRRSDNVWRDGSKYLIRDAQLAIFPTSCL